MTATPAELAGNDPAAPEQAPAGAAAGWTGRAVEPHPARGSLLDEAEWSRRHRVLQWVLGLHIPALFLMSLLLGGGLVFTAYLLLPTIVLLALSQATAPGAGCPRCSTPPA